MAKIIVTVGPKSLKPTILDSLRKAGAKSFRINLSHSDKDSLLEYISVLRSCNLKPALDTQGAQLRVVGVNGSGLYREGDRISVFFKGNFKQGQLSDNSIVINHVELIDQLSIGDILKVDFSGLAISIDQINKKSLNCSVIADGSVELNRAVDVTNKTIELSSLTDFDDFALSLIDELQVEEVYASFISSKEQLANIRSKIPVSVKLISKIETSLGVANCEDIARDSDEILIDRGDLSRETSIPLVPIATKRIIDICKRIGTPVNIATNILDSMMTSNLPSRAEVSDIYNLLDMGVSGLVLAAEVAIGKNPVSSVAFLKYLIDVHKIHSEGLLGIGYLKKPDKALIGDSLLNWL